MADQLAAATIGVLLEKAVSVAADKINEALGFRKDLEALQEHAKDIHDLLADAEAKQSKNQSVQSWLRKVKAAAFEAEDVLDELLYETKRRKVESRNKVSKAAKVCLFFSLSTHHLSFRWRMGSKVREINGKFEKFKLEALRIDVTSMEDSMRNMADQLVASTIGVLLEKAVSVAAEKIDVALGFRKDLEALQEHAKDIQDLLADAEAKQSKNGSVQSWLRKVKAAAFEAEDVLDELLYETLRRKVESRNKVSKAAKVCLFFSLSKHHLSFRWRMGSKVREINDMFKNFISEVPGIGLLRMEDSMRNMAKPEVVVPGRETNSLALQFVATRAKEEAEIVGKLLSASNEEASASVSVISIVGMGGLGKTTLAKSIYNNSRIKSHFAEKVWVCVSHEFDVTKLFRLILESLEGGTMESYSGQDPIVRKIQEKLAGKRFLLILDDVWNENQMLWNDFFNSLVGINSASGSCCLVTTRLQKTADIVSTFHSIILGRLTDDECWYILCLKATEDGGIIDGGMSQELDVQREKILKNGDEIDGEMAQKMDVHKERILKSCQELDGHRKQILKKCQGLPLAANVVGGLLSSQKREDWLSVVGNLEDSEDVEGEITRVLKWSFDYLPSLSIKKCFAYCSMYSKDTIMNGRELVELWMAEGFLQESTEGRTTMEEIGNAHLKVLLQSSLLERVDEVFLQMHDLVHDLAESVSKQQQSNGEVRHLAHALNHRKYNSSSTLFEAVEGEISDKVLLQFHSLRMLNLSGVKTENLPNAIGKVKLLRYLDVSDSTIKRLPDSLCKLFNLQTLNLNRCWSLQCLPRGLSNLISLRHLHFLPRDMKFKMPPNLGQLTCLQTLNFFSIGEEEKGHEIKELGSMKNLGGNICIRNLEFVKGKEGAKLANLFEKKNLVDLSLYWGTTDRGDNGSCNDALVLEGLEPHSKLRVFSLVNYMGDRLPQWFGQLNVLTKLRFVNCKSLKDLPTLGSLPYLENLQMEGLEHVTCIDESFYITGLWEGKVFPSLKTMELKNLPNLSGWKGLDAVNGPVFPKLESLVIRDCCQMASVPPFSFPSLEKLQIVGNIQVSVVRDIIGKSPSLLKKLEIKSMGGLNSLADVIENPLTCLERFEISDCSNLIDIPCSTFEACASLRSLYVYNCPKLMPCALNLQQTPSLRDLGFDDCPNMLATNALPTGFKYLTNLGDLSIGPFTDDSIKSFDWSGLIACSSTLIHLRWNGSLQKHSGLPQQLQHLTSLLWLSLDSLNSVEALPDWLGNLSSLITLEVRDCPILRCLPSAHAMGRLTELVELRIDNCPLLTESSVQEISTSLPNLHITRE